MRERLSIFVTICFQFWIILSKRLMKNGIDINELRDILTQNKNE
jgi:hypothetical protein